jgi:hypothetical protein
MVGAAFITPSVPLRPAGIHPERGVMNAAPTIGVCCPNAVQTHDAHPRNPLPLASQPKTAIMEVKSR